MRLTASLCTDLTEMDWVTQVCRFIHAQDSFLIQATFTVNVYNSESTAADAVDELYDKMVLDTFRNALSLRITDNVNQDYSVSDTPTGNVHRNTS